MTLILVQGDDPRHIPLNSVVAVDTETTGLDWEDDLIGVSLAWRDTEQKLCGCFLRNNSDSRKTHQLSLLGMGMEGEAIPDILIPDLIRQHSTLFINLPFDFRVLWKELQIEPGERMLDLSKIALGIEYHASLSLLSLYEKYVELAPAWVLEVKKNRANLHKLPPELVNQYAVWDAQATLLLYEKLQDKMVECLAKTLPQDLQFNKLVMDMIIRGVRVDQETLQVKKVEFTQRSYEIAKKLIGQGLKNPNSDQQVVKWLQNKGVDLGGLITTAKGQPSMAAEQLEALADPVVLPIIEYRQLIKGVSSWVDELSSLSSLDGKVHSRLDPFGTVSFRMSASDINMQAIPMKVKKKAKAFGSFMGVFIADNPEEELWAFDIKQAEVRLAAMLAKEHRLAKVFSSGRDPYSQMSLQVWKNDKRRDDAKRAMLASIYEIGPNSFAMKNHVSKAQAESVLNSFRRAFPDLRNASRTWERFVDRSSYVPLISGRKRWFGPFEEHYKAFNQLVQGSLAEVMQTIMLRVERDLPGRLRLQIHDSIILPLPRDPVLREPLVSHVKEIVLTSVPAYVQAYLRPSIPLECDVERWQ